MYRLWRVLTGCSSRRMTRRLASQTSGLQRRNAPISAARNGIFVISASPACSRSARAIFLINPKHPCPTFQVLSNRLDTSCACTMACLRFCGRAPQRPGQPAVNCQHGCFGINLRARRERRLVNYRMHHFDGLPGLRFNRAARSTRRSRAALCAGPRRRRQLHADRWQRPNFGGPRHNPIRLRVCECGNAHRHGAADLHWGQLRR